MTRFHKKRTSVIVEQVYMDKVISLIEKSGASGFTVYKDIYGKGKHGKKENFGSLSEFSGNVEVVTITSEEVALKILEGLQHLIDRDINLIVHVVDALVIRNNHFN